MIESAKKGFGIFNAAVKYNSIGGIFGDPGTGKSKLARAIQASHEGVVLITIDEENGDARGVVSLLYKRLPLVGHKTYREKLAAIISYVSKTRNVVILVDEVNKLKPRGLEVLRDIHDSSDADGRRNVPMVLFGDRTFYKLLVRARNGESSPIRPRLTRRIFPIYNIDTDTDADGSGRLYSVADIVRVLRNDRLRVVSDDGVKWLASLANVRGYGALGFAMAICMMAFDIARDKLVTAEDLRRALRMAIGPKATEDVDATAGGELLRASA